MGIGAVQVQWLEYKRGWKTVNSEVVEEKLVTIYVNGQELITVMATPTNLDKLAIGFLKNEGFIESIDEIVDLKENIDGCCVDIWLDKEFHKPPRKIITSGCGGGVTFDDPNSPFKALDSDLVVEPQTIYTLFNRLQTPTSLYARARGIHTAGLVSGFEIVATAEDVGRHNTIDKLVGECMVNGIETKGKLLLATGRVSSEMLRKSARMGCPIIASRNSPTSLSIEMAIALNITLIGYVRRGGMRVYSYPERLGLLKAQEVSIAG